MSQRADLARRIAGLPAVAVGESMALSYLHRSPVASYVSWARLRRAAALYRALARPGPVLDFGAGTGVLRNYIPADYSFVEHNDDLARAIPGRRQFLDALPGRHFGAVFALDCLEHNDDRGAIIDALAASLREDGVLILCGPTENWLYRLGRRLAGFTGEYHVSNIHDIEGEMAARLTCARRSRPSVLFRVSAWSLPQGRGEA